MKLSPTLSRRAALIALSALAESRVSLADSYAAYRAKLEEERRQAGENFKSARGPLTLLARLSPRDGKWTIGSDSSCSFALPSGPPHVGEINVRAGKAKLDFVTGVSAMVDGKPAHSVEADSRDPKPMTASVGEVRFHLYFIRGEQLQISVSDPNSALRREAQPLSWFPVDKRYRIVADWVPYGQPKHVMFLDNDGSSRERNLPGNVTFEVDGKKLSDDSDSPS